MGKSCRETLAAQLEDPEFRAEYEALGPEFELVGSTVREGNLGLSQGHLAAPPARPDLEHISYEVGATGSYS